MEMSNNLFSHEINYMKAIEYFGNQLNDYEYKNDLDIIVIITCYTDKTFLKYYFI